MLEQRDDVNKDAFATTKSSTMLDLMNVSCGEG